MMAKRPFYLITLLQAIVASGAQSEALEASGEQQAQTDDEPCYDIEIGLIFDKYPGETKWEITKGRRNSIENGNAVVLKTSPEYDVARGYSEASENHVICLPKGKYTFTIMDRNEDGMCCDDGEGRYALSYKDTGEMIIHGSEFEQLESTTFQLPYDAPQLQDTDGDGVEDRTKNVIPPVILNADTGLPECDNEFGLHLKTDDYGVETTWELRERSTNAEPDIESPPDGKVVASGGPYTSNFTYDISYCLYPGKYIFVFYDWQCDGLTGKELTGSYTLKVNDEDVYTGGTEMNKYWEEVKLEFVKEVEGEPVPATAGVAVKAVAEESSDGQKVIKGSWTVIATVAALALAWN